MRTAPISTIFIGNGIEGIPTLELLAASSEVTLVAVITQPDKPFGRSQKLRPSPIKARASELGLTIVTTEADDQSYREILDTYKPKLAICISFGQFLPEFFLTELPLKCLNIHYSLLPILRGAVPVQSAILNGLAETGVTIQVMEKHMDTGPIIAQSSIPIADDDTTPTLKEKLIPLGNSLLLETLDNWIQGSIKPIEQTALNATYCYMRDISRENAEIRWETKDCYSIERMVRALLPWPVAWTTLPDNNRLKIFQAELVEMNHHESPGTLLASAKGLYFATQTPHHVLNAQDVQREGKSRMSGEAFIKGYNRILHTSKSSNRQP